MIDKYITQLTDDEETTVEVLIDDEGLSYDQAVDFVIEQRSNNGSI